MLEFQTIANHSNRPRHAPRNLTFRNNPFLNQICITQKNLGLMLSVERERSGFVSPKTMKIADPLRPVYT